MPYINNDLIARYNKPLEYVINLKSAANLDPKKEELTQDEVGALDVIHSFFQEEKVKEGDWESAKREYQEHLKQQQTKKRSAKSKKTTNKSNNKSETPPPELQEEQPTQLNELGAVIQDNADILTQGIMEVVKVAIKEEVRQLPGKMRECYVNTAIEEFKENQQLMESIFTGMNRGIKDGVVGESLPLNSSSQVSSGRKQLPASAVSSNPQPKTSDNGTKNESSNTLNPKQ